MKTETYEVKVTCSNCNYSGIAKIRKGCYINEIGCPTCGCKSLDLKSEGTWTTKTKEIKIDLNKHFGKLDKMFDTIGDTLDSIFDKK